VRSFDAEMVLTNEEFSLYDSAFDITAFLIERGAYLAGYTFDGRSVGRMVKDAIEGGSSGAVSIPLMLAALQREQSLLSLGPIKAAALRFVPKVYQGRTHEGVISAVASTVLDTKLDWCLGYGCPDKGKDGHYPPRWLWLRGFPVQVREAARTYRQLFRTWKEGRSLTEQPLDVRRYGLGTIVPKNAATWAIYEFNPRLEGAKLSFEMFRKYGWLRS
jgi:hypothetical protein